MSEPTGRIAICPGSFDPMTMGHVDIIDRAARLFDRVVVAVAINQDKQALFSLDERVAIAREVFRLQPMVEVDTFEGLLVDYAQRRQASVIIRGLRSGVRLRIRVPDGADEPASDAQHRDDLLSPRHPNGRTSARASCATSTGWGGPWLPSCPRPFLPYLPAPPASR
jgi:cytidyltransferase-like protein